MLPITIRWSLTMRCRNLRGTFKEHLLACCVVARATPASSSVSWSEKCKSAEREKWGGSGQTAHRSVQGTSNKVTMLCVASVLSALGPPSFGLPEYLRAEADPRVD